MCLSHDRILSDISVSGKPGAVHTVGHDRPEQAKVAKLVSDIIKGDIEPVPNQNNPITGKRLSAPDYKVTSGRYTGKSIEVMFTSDTPGGRKPMIKDAAGTASRMEKSIENIKDHMGKADYVVMDLRGFPDAIKYQVSMWANYGDCDDPSKLIIIE